MPPKGDKDKDKGAAVAAPIKGFPSAFEAVFPPFVEADIAAELKPSAGTSMHCDAEPPRPVLPVEWITLAKIHMSFVTAVEA